ncbi:MAG: hypothetical protein CMD27_00295 [Flavobacteriales bacterium]|nr:hypothetical protein [Flavobacteriales bacterium]
MVRVLFFTICIFYFNNISAQADIVGGVDADIQDYPYQVALGGAGWGGGFSPYCGASIINEYWILTAAHCVQGESASSTSIRCGSDSDYAQGGTIYDAAEIISHPNYNANTYNNDIALIRLEDPISFNNNTQPVILMCDQQVALGVEDPGQMSWITGWGNTEGTTNSSQLQVVDVPITTQSNYGGNQIDADMIMAGYPDGGYDSCQGDSGGPMVVLAADGETFLQSGVVSWGYGCADAGYPGVYARVSYFIDWICENTNGAVCPNQSAFCDEDAVFGCTDSSAINYNSNATVNDGSCEYACDNTVALTLQLDCYGEEISWEITNENGATVASVSAGTYPGGSTSATMEEGGSLQEEEICLSAGCYTFTITDSYGDGLAGSQWSCTVDGAPFSMTDQDGALLFQENDALFGDCESLGDESLYDGPCSDSYSFCVNIGNPIYGCTDSEADNYNPNANINDNSCEYLGCTDDNYLEYDENANIDDGSCINLIVEGCIDDNADNYNPNANVDDGSCEYAYEWTPCSNQIWFEDFENYNTGNIDPQSSDWFGWDNTNSGADINTPGFYSGSQSIFIEQDDDVVHEFGELNSGSGELIFYVNIPSNNNSGGYFNVLHDYNAADSNWAFEVFFASNESGQASYISADTDVEFDASYDKWVEIRHVINIDNDNIDFYYDGNLIHSWVFSDGSAGASNVLGALNLYGACAGNNCIASMQVDNIELCGNFGNSNTNLTENISPTWFIHPNPNNGDFEVVINQNLNNIYLEGYNIVGEKIYTKLINMSHPNQKYSINLNQPPGTYILSIYADEYKDEKIIIIK